MQSGLIQPYFFEVGYRSPQYKLHDTKDEFTNQPYTISEVNVLYRPETEMAPLRYVTLNSMNYGSYMEYVDVEPVYIGTTHYGNEYKDNGRYQIELIQADAINTFTIRDSRSELEPSDLFRPGDIFTMEKYHEFFDEGKLDNGKDLGYSIKVVSIEGKGENAKAVIRITRE